MMPVKRMPENPFVTKRKEDKERLVELFKKHPDLSEREIIALFSTQTGYTKATIRRMIEELRDGKVIK